jgi:hypothetical protein
MESCDLGSVAVCGVLLICRVWMQEISRQTRCRRAWRSAGSMVD